MESCVFCQIADGETPTDLIYEDDLVLVFPDIHPIRPGHTMIIPRRHWPYFEDLPETTASRIIHVGQRLSVAMKNIYGVPRVAFAFTGGDHPHAHAHVIPMHEKTDLTFRSTPKASAADLAKSTAALRRALS